MIRPMGRACLANSGKEKKILVEGSVGASKYRQEVIGNFLRMINISTDCRFARIHKGDKDGKADLDKPVEFEPCYLDIN